MHSSQTSSCKKTSNGSVKRLQGRSASPLLACYADTCARLPSVSLAVGVGHVGTGSLHSPLVWGVFAQRCAPSHHPSSHPEHRVATCRGAQRRPGLRCRLLDRPDRAPGVNVRRHVFPPRGTDAPKLQVWAPLACAFPHASATPRALHPNGQSVHVRWGASDGSNL